MTEEQKDVERIPENEDLLFGGQVKPSEKPHQPRGCCKCTKKRLIIVSIILIMLLLYGLGLGIGLAVGLSRNGEDKLKDDVREVVGVVVSDNEACSDIGRDILAQWGTAVDAAIATLICNGVRTPHSMGIGGGCFMVVYDSHEETALYIDGRETVPKLMTASEYENMTTYNGCLFVAYDKKKKHIATFDGLPAAPRALTSNTYSLLTNRSMNARRIAVPGELKAYKEAYNRYGRLPWKDLFQPTIKMMTNGFPLSDATGDALDYLVNTRNVKLTWFPGLCAIYCANTTTGEPKKAGDIIHLPKLAETLQRIADEGIDYIYNSPVTNTIVDEIKQEGGILEITDFINEYTVKVGNPLKIELDNTTVYTMDGATGGPVIGLILNIMKRYDWLDMTTLDGKVDYYHRLIEAMKFADADRMELGDPDYDNTTWLLQKMRSEEYADIIRTKITPETHDQHYYTDITESYDEEMGTSHMSVLSPYGDAVSVTSTVNYYFGSMIVSNSTGIIWNNEMDDFDTNKKGTVNRIQPGKRPRSSMAPVIAVDNRGDVRVVTGGAGGSYIATSVAQILTKLLLLEMPLDEVIDAKRLHHKLTTNRLVLEQGFPEDVAKLLTEERGHVSETKSRLFSVIESISVDSDGTILGYADKRKQKGKASYMYKQTKQKS